MGLLSAIGGAISSGISALGSAVGGALSGICGALGSALAGTAIGEGIAAIATGVCSIAAALGIPVVAVIAVIAVLVCGIAVALGLKEEGKDDPDELAMKAEKADKKPEDFDSTEEYLNYLHNEIELTPEEREKLENMSPEERAAYQVVGCAIYLDAIKEKLMLETPISIPFIHDAAKLHLSPKDVLIFIKILDGAGVSTKDMSNLLHETASDLKTANRTMNAMVSAIKEITPGISDAEIDQKIKDMYNGVK